VRILVLGGGGQLGRELAALHNVARPIISLSHAQCDIARPGDAARTLVEYRPDAVVNCAAWTAVDAAESDRDGAFRSNAQGAEMLAQACRASRVRLLHLSTDYVFDGSATEPIDEAATTNPLGVYGASKLAGEQAVRAYCANSLVVRTAWLYGKDGPNFVLTMLRLGAERDEVRVVADQHGAPTWTGHLAPALLRLAERGIPGTYHLTNAGVATWHEVAVAVMELAGLGCRVVPITAAEYGAPAPRPAYSVLDNRAWRLLGEMPLPPWQEGLRAYLAQRGVLAATTRPPQ
jgi:dTDP-4-dehydrorhamnose reductase